VRRLGGDFPAHEGAITDLVLTPDQKHLLTGDSRGEVKRWDLAAVEQQLKKGGQAKPERSLNAHAHGVTGFAMSPDGSRFATAGQDNVVKVWDTATGKELATWDFHIPATSSRSLVRSLTFTPDNRHVVTANADTTCYLLEVP